MHHWRVRPNETPEHEAVVIWFKEIQQARWKTCLAWWSINYGPDRMLKYFLTYYIIRFGRGATEKTLTRPPSTKPMLPRKKCVESLSIFKIVPAIVSQHNYRIQNTFLSYTDKNFGRTATEKASKTRIWSNENRFKTGSVTWWDRKKRWRDSRARSQSSLVLLKTVSKIAFKTLV